MLPKWTYHNHDQLARRAGVLGLTVAGSESVGRRSIRLLADLGRLAQPAVGGSPTTASQKPRSQFHPESCTAPVPALVPFELAYATLLRHRSYATCPLVAGSGHPLVRLSRLSPYSKPFLAKVAMTIFA